MEGDRADRATIAIWELEVWWRAQLEGDRAATAVCELVVCLVADEGDSYNCYLGTRVLGGRPSWNMGYNCNLGTRGFLWWLGWPSSTAMCDLGFLGGGHLRITCQWPCPP